MPSHDPITGQPFDFSSSSGITDITTDTTLLGKGTPEEPLKVTNPEKDIFLEVDNIEIGTPNLPFQSLPAQTRNGRHAEIDLCHFERNHTSSIQVYEQQIDSALKKRYYFIPIQSKLSLSFRLAQITNKEIDKLIVGVELGKQFEQHPTMEHIVANFQKRHHYHTFCDSLFLVQRDYKTTTRLHNLLSVDREDVSHNLTERRYYKNAESDSVIYEMNNADERGQYGYIMGTPYSATNFLGGVIGYDAFSAVNYISQELAIFDSIFGIEHYIVQAMYIAGTGLDQTLEIELNLINNGNSQPLEIRKYVSGGIHIYLP